MLSTHLRALCIKLLITLFCAVWVAQSQVEVHIIPEAHTDYSHVPQGYAEVEVLPPAELKPGQDENIKMPSMGYSVDNSNGVAVVAHSTLTGRPKRSRGAHAPHIHRRVYANPPIELASVVIAFAAAIKEAQRRELELALERLTPETPGQITIIAEGYGEDVQGIIDAKSKETGLIYRVRKQTHPGLDGLHTHFIISPDFLISHGNHFHRASDTARYADYLLISMFIVFIASFGAVALWKKKHPESYDLCVLLGLWLMPAYVAFQAQFYRFLSVWALFSGISLYLLFKATRRPLSGSTPRRVYSWFMHTYNLSYYIALLGAIIMSLPLIGFDIQFQVSDDFVDSKDIQSEVGVQSGLSKTRSIAYYGFMLLFYGLYFGVLGRDTASVCVTWLAKTMGRAVTVEPDGSSSVHKTPLSPSTSSLPAGMATILDEQADGRKLSSPTSLLKLEAKKGVCALCQEMLRSASQQQGAKSSLDLEERKRRAGIGAGLKNLSKDDAIDGDLSDLEAEESRSLVTRNACIEDNEDDADVELISESPNSLDAVVKPVADPRDEKTYKLPCGHVFHEFCIRGWLLVGKRDTCPTCHECCSAREHFNRSPREIQSIVWSQLLDYLRFVLVVNPTIFLLSKFALQTVY